MGNIPIHAMIVHFPIVLAILLPVAAGAAVYLIRHKTVVARAWSLPFLLTIMLLGSSYAAIRTGTADEQRVDLILPQQASAQHQETAEQFILIVAMALVIGAGGFARGRVGALARTAAIVVSLAVVIAGYRVGKAGAELASQKYAATSAANQ